MVDRREISDQVSKAVDRLRASEDRAEWEGIVDEMVPLVIAYWDAHPHSAMEMLEVTVSFLPVRLAHALVRLVVRGWKAKLNYNPTAGGSADHCYLSALILSDNYDLADQPWGADLLPSTLNKELSKSYSRFDRYRDGEAKKRIVEALAREEGWRPSD